MNATLSHSCNYLLCYFVIYFGAYIAHSELLRRLFGQTLQGYNSFALSQFTLFKILLASIEFDSIQNSSYKYQLIFYSFYFLVYVVLAGVFLAIINDSYSFVLENYEKRPELDYFGCFRSKFSKGQRIDIHEENDVQLDTEDAFESMKLDDFRNKLIRIGFDVESIDVVFQR